MVLAIPLHALVYPALEAVLWFEPQFVAGIADVAYPVALLHDAELVAVQRAGLAQESGTLFGNDRNNPESGDGNLHRYHPTLAQRRGYVPAELRRGVGPPLGEEIASARHAPVDGLEDGLHQILHVDEGDELRFVSHRWGASPRRGSP